MWHDAGRLGYARMSLRLPGSVVGNSAGARRFRSATGSTGAGSRRTSPRGREGPRHSRRRPGRGSGGQGHPTVRHFHLDPTVHPINPPVRSAARPRPAGSRHRSRARRTRHTTSLRGGRAGAPAPVASGDAGAPPPAPASARPLSPGCGFRPLAGARPWAYSSASYRRRSSSAPARPSPSVPPSSYF